MKKLFLTIALFAFSLNAFAVGKVIAPVNNQSATSIAGRASNGDAVPILADSLGNLGVSVVEATGTTLNFSTVIPLSGPTDRTQLGSHTQHQCLFQAPLTNVGSIYVGGSTVTNTSGANEGLALVQGDIFGPVPLANTNEIYFASDNDNDVVKSFCK